MEIKQTQKFHKWFSKLDNVTSAIVFARLLVVSRGSLGLWRSVGNGVSELKKTTVQDVEFTSPSEAEN